MACRLTPCSPECAVSSRQAAELIWRAPHRHDAVGGGHREGGLQQHLSLHVIQVAAQLPQLVLDALRPGKTTIKMTRTNVNEHWLMRLRQHLPLHGRPGCSTASAASSQCPADKFDIV